MFNRYTGVESGLSYAFADLIGDLVLSEFDDYFDRDMFQYLLGRGM